MNGSSSKLLRLIRFSFYSVCLGIFFEIHASAYIDPATTSYIIQIVVGILIAAGTALGIFWNKIKRKFKKSSGEELPKEAQEPVSHGGVITAADLMAENEDDNK